MAKNDYIKRQKDREQKVFDAGIRIGIQQCWDFLQLALRDQEVMGRDILGRARLEKVYQGIKVRTDYFHTAFTNEKEADVRQEELDRCLREIWEDDLVPFYERYDELKKFKYDKAKKGWVD